MKHVDVKADSGTKVTLKRSEVRDLYAAIEGLNGRPRDVKDKNGEFKGLVVDPFTLGCKGSYAAAKTAENLKPVIEYQERVQTRIIKQAYGEDEPDGGLVRCIDVLNDLADEEIEVSVFLTDKDEFKFEENMIPPSAQRKLFPMCVGWKREEIPTPAKSKFEDWKP